MSIAGTIAAHVEEIPSGAFVRASDFGGSRSSVDTSLHRLVRSRGDFVRVVTGLYWKGSSSRFGPGWPSVIDTAVAAAGPDSGIGPASWSATHALGLSAQLPSTPEFAVVGRIPERVKGARFHRRSNVRRLGLGYLEIALLEVLREWPKFSGTDWGGLVSSVGRLIESESISLDRMGLAIESERSPAARTNFQRVRDDVATPTARSA